MIQVFHTQQFYMPRIYVLLLFCQIEALLGGGDAEALGAGTDLPADPEVLQTVIESSQAEITNLLDHITEEERKMEQYKVSSYFVLTNAQQPYIVLRYIILSSSLSWFAQGVKTPY